MSRTLDELILDDERLHIAAMGEDLETISRLVRENPKLLNVANKRGETPLWAAAFYRRTKSAKLLLELGADQNKSGDFGMTPLFVAAQNENSEIVKLLLERGADHSTPANDGATPLWIAARYGHIEIVKLLAAAGADPSTPDNDGTTPRHVATRYGHIETVRFLAAVGASPSTPDNHRVTPFAIAVGQMDSEIRPLLLDLMRTPATPLYIACAKGDKIAAIRFMLDMTHEELADAQEKLSAGPYWPCVKDTFMECRSTVELFPGAHTLANRIPNLVFLAASKVRLWGLPVRTTAPGVANALTTYPAGFFASAPEGESSQPAVASAVGYLSRSLTHGFE